MMEQKRLSLIQSLFVIVNKNRVHDPDYILATYFLQHYKNLGTLNIYEIADACFVSRSSVRRFSQQLGYDNFKELKDEFRNLKFEYDYFMKKATALNYHDWLINELKTMIFTYEHDFDQNKIIEIARRIHDSQEVIFLSSYSTLMELTEFQRPLILSGKLIKIMSEQNLNSQQIHDLSKHDFLVTVSSSGNFANSINSIITKNNAYKLLITASKNSSYSNSYNDIFYLSKDDYTNTKSVYGKYGLIFLFDVLYSTYIKMYGVTI